MHYQQSIKSQEPPRLHPPANSVPVTGKEIAYTHEESKLQKNPLNLKSEADRQMSEQLFKINCSLCHGDLGNGGNATIIGTLLSSGGLVPADLTSTNTKSRSDGDIFYIITNGSEALGTQGMPKFKNLLTPNERWAIILHIRELQKNQ
jgi:mono/diheme cytochrome c family protein